MAHTSYYDFSHCCLLVKLNVEAYISSNALVLRSYLHKLDFVHKELEAEAFS
jgi:hypothetical protein